MKMDTAFYENMELLRDKLLDIKNHLSAASYEADELFLNVHEQVQEVQNET
jgi:hypothetical protein